ncbi:MAG: hypothetical protein ACRDK3_10605 [Actinomycetota bacterium]
MKKIALVLSLVLIGVTGYAFIGGDDGLPEMTLERLRGEVTVLRAGEQIEVRDEMGIGPDDRISTGSQGRAELRLQGQRRVELAPDSVVVVAGVDAVDGMNGSLLGSSHDGDALDLSFGSVTASTRDGSLRVDLGTGSSRVGVYTGNATISSPGVAEVEIDRLFEADVAGNERVLDPTPLAIDQSDAWDQIHLSEVLRLDDRITKLGNGLATQLGGARPGIDYFGGLVQAPVGFLQPYLRRERVPDLLIGFTIARTVEPGLPGAFAQAFEYRDQGGSWGVIARIMSTPETRLIAQLESAIIETGILAADTSDGPSFGPVAESTGGAPASGGTDSSSPGPGDGTGDGGTGGSPPDDSGGGKQPPSEPEEPPEEDECSPTNPVACIEDPPIGDLLDEGKGLLP